MLFNPQYPNGMVAFQELAIDQEICFRPIKSILEESALVNLDSIFDLTMWWQKVIT